MPVVFMMLGGIGLPGGAVYIERHLIRSRWWETAVSLAGPAINVPMILLISLAFKLGWVANDPANLISVSLGFLLMLEVSAILLNLIPIPPLDGFQAIAPWLPAETRERLFAMSNQGQFILFAALWFVKPFNHAFWETVWFISSGLGVDPYIGWSGYKAFRFWEH
jgi:Zn-dependent protease